MNHPPRLLLIGACLLAANVGFPFVFRIPALQEDSATRAPFAEVVLPLLWNYWMPVLALVLNCLSRPKNRGGIEPEKSWFPLVTAGLSVAATGVHLAATGYVYSVVWQSVWLVPSLWAVAWTGHHRLTDFSVAPSRLIRAVALTLPVVVTLPAIEWAKPALFWELNLLNALLLGWEWRKRPQNRAAFELGILALCAAFAGWLVDPTTGPLGWWKSRDVLAPWLLAYVTLRGLLSRNPRGSLAASVSLMIGLLTMHPTGSFIVHRALQLGLLVFMLHSLFWLADVSSDAGWGRRLAALVWVLHSMIWMDESGLPAVKFVLGASTLLLAVCGVVKWLDQIRFPWFLLVSAGTVLAVGGVGWLKYRGAELLPGVGALVLSLLLFAAGTLLALSREKWGLTSQKNQDNHEA